MNQENPLTEINSELELAFNYVEKTGENIFLTGSAGTGKTTFLRSLRQRSGKRMIVVAPTGVAAINATGVTIHSFFQIGFGPQVPTRFDEKGQEKNFRFNRDKINIIKSLQLLIIDEISMVRADLLDAVDQTLRRFREPNLPFGGVQLLLIGDLQQLSPVAREEEWELLKGYYKSPYFFDALVFNQCRLITIRLKKNYRQSDDYFISLLRSVGDGNVSGEVLTALNSRFNPDIANVFQKGYIHLTTHNRQANEINSKELKALKGKSIKFIAEITGIFPDVNYPVETELEVKVGAQVMFIKNDPGKFKRYFNGKIGEVKSIKDESIEVLCEGNDLIEVERVVWNNLKYIINEETKEIEEEVIGTFTHFPLRLAWAITIHKSQGLTFDKVILDAQAAFAHGQVYVALSRCRTFEGLVLSSKIYSSGVIRDRVVGHFIEQQDKLLPDLDCYKKSRETFFRMKIREMFLFKPLISSLEKLVHKEAEHPGAFAFETSIALREIYSILFKEIAPVSNRFISQIESIPILIDYPGGGVLLEERIIKASEWFGQKLLVDVHNRVATLDFKVKSKELNTQVLRLVSDFKKTLGLMISRFAASKEGFDLEKYLRAEALSEIDLGKVDFLNANTKDRNKNKVEKKPLEKKDKRHTREITLELLRDGVSIKEISMLRGLQEATIYSHIRYYVGNEVPIETLIDKEKYEKASQWFLNNPDVQSMTECRNALGEGHSFNELGLILSSLWNTEKLERRPFIRIESNADPESTLEG
ncbi:MAG: AAA family ATPase [Sphingobacteriia bacterium]|nr:AAA family ATPase [Sphingobacteriia bacterium]